MAPDPAPPRGGGSQLAGQPWWVWAAGGVALLGGYVYLRRKGTAAGTAASASGTGTTATATGTTSPTGLSWEQFLLFLHDQQGSSSKTTTTTTTTSAGGSAPPPPPGKPGRKPGPRRKPVQPPLMSGSYTVRPGQSLASIAKTFGISRVELAHANGLGTGAGLRTGQKLRVPG